MSERVEEIRERVEGAKPGPWTPQWLCGDTVKVFTEEGRYVARIHLGVGGEGYHRNTAATMIESRQDIPYLLDRLSETEEKLERAVRALEDVKKLNCLEFEMDDPDREILYELMDKIRIRIRQALREIRYEEPTDE